LASLLFGSKGTELALTAGPQAHGIVLSAESIDLERPLPECLGAVTSRRVEFLQTWTDFLLTVSDALAEFAPDLRSVSQWVEYRAAILAAAAPL
jgi:hypothetical protein